jgi:hypothetical protein
VPTKTLTARGFAPLLHSATVDALGDSVRRHMPAGPLRERYDRALDPTLPGHADDLRATGIPQLVNLYARLVDGLVDEVHWTKVGELFARIAVYQAYEIVSDSLAHGLAPGAATGPGGDRSAAQRRHLLRTFNTAMTVRLRGAGRTADLVFSQPRHPTGAAREIWPVLVANIEAAVELAGSLDGSPLGPLLREGLVERYRAVNRTLSSHHLSPLELAAVGANTALVSPTLAYCVGVVADLVHPVPGLAEVVADGTLADALHDAALLARLLNDAGTPLLGLTPSRRRAVIAGLRRAGPARLESLLLADLFSRLRKDLRHGEFNVVLYAARRAPDTASALDALESSLNYYARLYALHSRRLAGTLRRLTRRLGDHRPAALIERFVAFHVALYANPYDRENGEYAVSGS